MRALFLGLIGLATAGFAQQTARPGSIEGRVLDASTGAPLRKTTLTLRPVAGQQRPVNQSAPGQPGTPQIANTQARQQSTTTDSEGRFSFSIDRAGDFRIGADHTGYVRGEYGSRRPGAAGKAVTVGEGQRVTGIDVKLTPQGVIAGRIVDEDGDPVERAQVTVTPRIGGQNNQGRSATTNDLGEFRVSGLPAGKYFVMAQRMGVTLNDQDKPGQTGQETYAVTYFPGATDAASAATISVAPGQQVSGIFVPLRKTRVFKVSGIISGSIGDDVEKPVVRGPNGQVIPLPAGRGPGANRIILNLVERGGPSTRNLRRTLNSRVTNADGSFEVPAVPPGSYWAMALSERRGAVVVGRTAVEVRNANVANVVVPVSPPVTVTGIAHGESRDPLTLTNTRLLLSSLDDTPTSGTNGTVAADGTFQIPNSSRARFRVGAINMPDGVYLKTVRVGGQDVTKAGIDLNNASASMAIDLTFSSKAASITGTVKLESNDVPGRVMLAPDPYDDNTPPMTPVGSLITVNATGAFTIKNVPPGNYRLYAFEDIDAQSIDAALLRRVESRSAKLSLSESSTETVELKQIPVDETTQ